MSDLPPEVQTTPSPSSVPIAEFPEAGLDLTGYLLSIERDLIERSLDRTGGNRNKAAALLGLKRTTLVEKLKRMGSV